jgi:hypothetical protein
MSKERGIKLRDFFNKKFPDCQISLSPDPEIYPDIDSDEQKITIESKKKIDGRFLISTVKEFLTGEGCLIINLINSGKMLSVRVGEENFCVVITPSLSDVLPCVSYISLVDLP